MFPERATTDRNDTLLPKTSEENARFTTFRIGDWFVDPSSCTLVSGSIERKLRPRTMDLLVCLAERKGKILLREEALERVWPDVVVEESAVTHCISEIRTAFDDSARSQSVIKTFPKRGYALLVPADFGDSEQGAAIDISSQIPRPGARPATGAGLAFPIVVLLALLACSLLLVHWS